jgi:hypothetical protein
MLKLKDIEEKLKKSDNYLEILRDISLAGFQ